jgi:hypothetical protein
MEYVKNLKKIFFLKYVIYFIFLAFTTASFTHPQQARCPAVHFLRFDKQQTRLQLQNNLK